MIRRPPRSTLFPTRRSSDLGLFADVEPYQCRWRRAILYRHGDRKSTRLNSSHSQISYAVFCLKKKKELDSSEGLVIDGVDRHSCNMLQVPQILQKAEARETF